MPLSLRSRSNPVFWRQQLLDGLLFLSAAALLAWSLPIRLPWIGLDPGWVEALVQATDSGRSFGGDVVFTFGPYHQLYTGQLSENLTPFIVGRWLYGLGWGAALLSVRRLIGHPLSWSYLVVLALLSSQRLDALFMSFCFTISLTAICRTRRGSLAWPSFICLLTALLLGILIKLSFLALAVPTIAILVAVELGQLQARPVANGLRLLAIPMIAMLLLSTAGMSASEGWEYLAGPNRDIVSGYSEAMALFRRRNDWMQLPYWLASGGTISLLTLGLQRRLGIQQRWKLLIIMLLALLFFWVPFKAGMVRHDGGHAPMAGLFLLTSSLLVLFCLWKELHWQKRLVAPLLLLPVLVGYSISNKRINWDLQLYRSLRMEGINAFMSANRSESGRENLRSQRRWMLEELDNRDDLVEDFSLPKGATADLLPWDTTDLVVNGLSYTPRPIPHSLNPYSATLLELNRAFFADPDRRPRFVIINRKMIDNRWPSVDLDGPALTEIARHYRFHSRGSKGSLVLELSPHDGTEVERTIFKSTFDLSQGRSTSRLMPLPEDIPPGSSISFQFKPTLLYKLSKVIYRPPFVARVRVDFADGGFKFYRVIPGASEQLPLAPIPADNDDLLTYVKTKQRPLELDLTPESTPVALKLQLRWKGGGGSPPLRRYFSEVSLSIQAPDWSTP